MANTKHKLPLDCNYNLCKSCDFEPIKHKCETSTYIKRDRITKTIVRPHQVLKPYKISLGSSRYNRIDV